MEIEKMKGYKTYKEAKEKHPDREIVRPTQKNIDEFNEPDLFHPVIENCLYSDGYEYLLKKGNGPRISDGYWCVVGESKPRTKTEFVKCEYNHAWEIIKLYEDGEELFKADSDEFQIERINSIALRAQARYPFYRKVETEIDERQEFIDTYASLRHEFHGQRTYDDFSGFMYDSGKFKLVE